MEPLENQASNKFIGSILILDSWVYVTFLNWPIHLHLILLELKVRLGQGPEGLSSVTQAVKPNCSANRLCHSLGPVLKTLSFVFKTRCNRWVMSHWGAKASKGTHLCKKVEQDLHQFERICFVGKQQQQQHLNTEIMEQQGEARPCKCSYRAQRTDGVPFLALSTPP